MKQGSILSPVIGLIWGAIMAVTVAILLAFSTGGPMTPQVLITAVLGAGGGFAINRGFNRWLVAGSIAIALLALTLLQPFGPSFHEYPVASVTGVIVLALSTALPLSMMMRGTPSGQLSRYEYEEVIVRFLTGFGYLLFTSLVFIPFYVMLMTSLKSQRELVQNPLDFSINLTQEPAQLFRSYIELFRDFNFGDYLLTSAIVSVATVLITLAFSIPGAYAVARLRFRGRAALSRSILLIYMVPMIVLALPIYIAFSLLELRNSITGILLIYPVTTIPVALYMLQGYFRGLPHEVEEAGLMDGLSRLGVIWKITLPLSLPALASVSLYVFMIAWNEFLLAFMLLDDPSKFTLTRGVAMLNSSEIPRQHLMAGSMIATLPVMILFLGLERFMTRGLTAGSVKG